MSEGLGPGVKGAGAGARTRAGGPCTVKSYVCVCVGEGAGGTLYGEVQWSSWDPMVTCEQTDTTEKHYLPATSLASGKYI